MAGSLSPSGRSKALFGKLRLPGTVPVSAETADKVATTKIIKSRILRMGSSGFLRIGERLGQGWFGEVAERGPQPRPNPRRYSGPVWTVKKQIVKRLSPNLTVTNVLRVGGSKVRWADFQLLA